MNIEDCIHQIKRCFPQVAIHSTRLMPRGRDNVVAEVNDEIMFRFPRRPDVETQLLMEIRVLPVLAKRLSTPIPQFEYIWYGDEQYRHPFVGYQKLHGIFLDDERIATSRRSAFVSLLSQFLNELHSFPVEQAIQLGAREYTPATWRQRYRRRYEQIQEAVFPLLDTTTRSQSEQLWERFLTGKVYTGFRPVFVHRDLWLHHILCSPEQDIFTGVIDWGDAEVGDPALDFLGVLASWGKDFVEMVLSGYQGDIGPYFYQKADFYLRCYPPYSEALKAVQAGNQTEVAYWLGKIREVVDK